MEFQTPKRIPNQGDYQISRRQDQSKNQKDTMQSEGVPDQGFMNHGTP
jgi:hypothetical protein